MEVPGVGTLPYAAPAEEHRGFFERKYRTSFRAVNEEGGGVMTRAFYLSKLEERTAQDLEGRPLEKRTLEEVMKEKKEIWDFWSLLEREKITENEFVRVCLDRVFGSVSGRKALMQRWTEDCKMGFWCVDKNGDNRIQLNEFSDWFNSWGMKEGTHTESVFNAIDADGDGEISYEEWMYAFINWGWCNTDPSDPINLFFGTLVD